MPAGAPEYHLLPFGGDRHFLIDSADAIPLRARVAEKARMMSAHDDAMEVEDDQPATPPIACNS
jgi:hypothetical protein